MATEVVETTGSYQASESDGKTTASRSFVVYNSDQTELTITDAIRAEDMPRKYDPHPQLGSIYATSYDLQKVEGLWGYEVTWNYAPLDSTDQEEQPGEAGYEEFSMEIAVQYRDAWRTDGTVAITMPGSGDPTTSDIAGDPVDTGGEPISQAILVQVASFSKIVQGFPSLSASRALIGKRNDAAFLGAPIGTLVYAGARVERTDVSLYRVSHSLHFDQLFHLHQVPKREADGNPELDDDLNANEILYRQPFPKKGGFGSLGIGVGIGL